MNKRGTWEVDRPKNLYILYTEKLLYKLAYKFYQDPIRTTIRVTKQGHDNITVAELKER
jgi:hypothetical protein